MEYKPNSDTLTINGIIIVLLNIVIQKLQYIYMI